MQPKISNQEGFTLLELIITTAIVAVISMISNSAYTGYVDTTKNSEAAIQIRTLSFLINDYVMEYGQYPDNLEDIGNENLKDPWGNPYVYLNLHSGSGSGGHGGGGHADDGSSDQDDTNVGAARKDGNLVPINTNYDLCSFGKDGKRDRKSVV